MTRAKSTFAIALAVALGAALGGCESADGPTVQAFRSLWPFDSTPSGESQPANSGGHADDQRVTAPTPSRESQPADNGARTDDQRPATPSPPPPAAATPPASATAPPPPAVASPPPTLMSPPLLANPAQPAIASRKDPMVLKKALQDGEALPVSLPREAMVKLFRTLEPFQPSAQQLKIIEAYGQQMTGTERARLRYEMQSCQPTSTCVVVPQR